MYVVFDKVDRQEFKNEEKTGNGSSFVRHLDEKPSKMENRRKSAAFREFETSNSGASAMPPIAGPTPNTPSVVKKWNGIFSHSSEDLA